MTDVLQLKHAVVKTVYFCSEAHSKSGPASRTIQLTLIEVFPKIKLHKHKLLCDTTLRLRSQMTRAPDIVGFIT